MTEGRFFPYPSDDTHRQWLQQRIPILRSNPRFPTVAVDHAANIVKIFEGRYKVNKIMSNMARTVICFAVLALHFGREKGGSGAVVSKIQDITTKTGLCSKNTTAATIHLMEQVGFVTRKQSEDDRRNWQIEPSDILLQYTGSLVETVLASADKLFPYRRYSQLIENAPDFSERYYSSNLRALEALAPLVSNPKAAGIFALSDGGGALLSKLMAGKQSEQYLNDGTVSLPFDSVGELFGVSRTHVRRLFKKAEEAGLVLLHENGGRRIEILPALDLLHEEILAAHIARTQFVTHLANEDYDLLPVDQAA